MFCRANYFTWRCNIGFLVFGIGILSSTVVRAQAPIVIPNGISQLFIDDYLIESQKGLSRKLHEPMKENGGNEPLLAIDHEFGNHPATLEANGTIIYDPHLKKYVMYAVGFSSAKGIPTADKAQIFRFTSSDAIHWIKGDDGHPERIVLDLHDVASDTSATNTDLFSCFYDKEDAIHPYKGWAYFANWPGEREGVYYVDSADGRLWRRGPRIMKAGARIIEQDGRTLQGPSDVTTFFHDDVTHQFLAALKFSSPTALPDGNRLRSRAYLFVPRLDESVNLQSVQNVALVPAGADSGGDQISDEYYASGGWRYQSLWLGELKIWHGHGDYPYSAAGSAFLKLAVSRDGIHWHKVSFENDLGQNEVFIPNGAEGGNHTRNDGGYITLFSQGPLRIGNELIFYYGSSSFGKNHGRDVRMSGGGIFRAHLHPDGFVSVEGGKLTTKLLMFKGNNLYLNSVGPVRIDILDDQGNLLAQGFANADSLEQCITLGSRSLGDVIHHHPARLRFTVGAGGHLYSFSCR